jgi:hypothetical protein
MPVHMATQFWFGHLAIFESRVSGSTDIDRPSDKDSDLRLCLEAVLKGAAPNISLLLCPAYVDRFPGLRWNFHIATLVRVGILF